MAIPTQFLTTTCDVYRPFGTTTRVGAAVPCRLVADFSRGRPVFSGGPTWTHYIDLDPAADVQDGVTRSAGSAAGTYADGDEVRVPSGASTPRYVVVWVERVHEGTAREYKRAYLARDTA